MSATQAGQTFRMATSSEMGTYHAVGKAITTLIRLKRENSFNIGLQTTITSGVQENVRALLKAEVDIAFVDANTLLKAMNRKAPFEDLKNGQDLRVLMPLWPNIGHVIVADTLETGSDLDDIKAFSGEVLFTGSAKSHAGMAARDLLTKNGLYYDRLFRVANLRIDQAFQAFTSGGVPAMVYFTHQNDQRVSDLMKSRERPPLFVSVTPDQVAKLNQGTLPIWQRHTLPANTYPNQTNPIDTVAQYNYLVVRKSFPNEIAAMITRTLVENPVFLKMLNPAALHIDFEGATNHPTMPFHDGALGYFDRKNECKTIFCLF